MQTQRLARETRDIVQSVGRALMARLDDAPLRYSEKDGFQDLVTQEDVRVQETLIAALQRLLPEAAFFAEEQENAPLAGHTWIIDPIDGTTNFIAMRRNFAISVALYDGTQPIFGVVYDVAANITYMAVVGAGALCNERALPPLRQTPMHCCLLDVGLSSLNNLSRRAQQPLHLISRALRGHRAIGSAALAICHIASGDIQAYVSSKLRPWDHAAARIVLEEVGGMIAPIYDTDNMLDGAATAILAAENPILYKSLQYYFLHGVFEASGNNHLH